MTTPSQNPSGTQASGATSRGGANGSNLKDSASQLAEQAKSEGKRHVETARKSTADSVEKLARSAKAAASELQQDDVGHLSQYIANLADGMTSFASRMRDKSGEEMAQELGRLARENPALFVTGSVAVGFGLARFARAKTPGTRTSGSTDFGGRTGVETDRFGSDSAYAGTGLGASGMDATSSSGRSGAGGAGIGSSGIGGAGGAGYVSTGLDSTAANRGSDRGTSTGSNLGGASGLNTQASQGAGSTGGLDSSGDRSRTPGISGGASGPAGSTGVDTAGIAGTPGSGTTGLNNYSPGSNLASGAGTQAGQDARKTDETRSPQGNRGGLNS